MVTLNVDQQLCGRCPSASEPEAARLTALPHLVQELDASAGREPARPPGSRTNQECQDAECVCLPARSASGSWPVTLYSVTRTFMQTSNATATMGYCAVDRGRHPVASVPVPLVWNSKLAGGGGAPRSATIVRPCARNAAIMTTATWKNSAARTTRDTSRRRRSRLS